MKKPSARVRSIAVFSAAPIAVLIAGGLVWQSSNAAFSDTSRSSGNAWSTGTVILNDDDLGAAAFTVEKMVPEQTGQKCLVVTSQSNVPGEVRMYATNLGAARGLEDRIKLDVEQGTGGSFNDCAGFVPAAGDVVGAQSLTALRAANFNYATGASPWQTGGVTGEARTYRLTWDFDVDGLTQGQIDALQGSRVSLDLMWELQSDETPS